MSFRMGNSRKIVFSALQLPVLMAAVLFLAEPGVADAAVTTAAGTVTVQSGNRFIQVTAPYAEDTDADNTLKIEWGLDAVDFSLGSQTISHQNTPYTYAITGLTDGTAYQVRATYQDPDGVTGAAVQTIAGIIPTSPLMHNSVTMGSSKWAGGWGITGGRYGLFSCTTCHVRGAGNIKQVTASVPASIGPNVDKTVSFQATTGAASFGDDTGGHATSSKICEVCHTQTRYHRYDTAGQPGGTDHYNGENCTECHQHRRGFLATCHLCHGSAATGQYWPDGGGGSPAYADDSAGAHANHVRAIGIYLGYGDYSVTMYSDAQQKAVCAFCHPTPGGTGHTLNGGGDSRVDVAGAGAFRKYTGSGASTADAGSGAYNLTTLSCSNLACHNNKTTPAWNAAATGACTVCHSRSTSGSNPSSGLHYGSTPPTVSGTWHDDTLTAINKCTVCHSSLTSQGTHINGQFTGNGSVAGDRTAMGLFSAYTSSGADNVGTCSGAGVASGCHAGAGDNGTWARKWDSSIHYAATGNECKGCHGGFGGTDWTFGATANTVDGSVEHNRNWDGDGAASEIPGNHKNNLANGTRCNICHVYADTGYAWATHHRNGSIDMNSTMGYAQASWNCTDTCHSNNASHNLEDSGWPVNSVAGPALACTDCHTGSGAGAFAVGPASTHVDADGAGATYTAGTCTDCHSGHANGTTGVNDVEIPTTYGVGTPVPTMNLQYVTHGSKIQLGGAATAAYGKSTEAEICWACHDARGISEWGQNNNPNTGGLGYDYGDLYTDLSTVPGTKTSNWTTGFWRSGKGRASGGASNPFWYKRGQIQSTHAANYGGTFTAAVTAGNSLGYNRTETRDAVANIRCTYCHDVHGTHNGVAGDPSNNNQPYLRGTWKGNPYPEDGAPQWGMTNWTVDTPTANTFGRAPRGSASSTNSGLSVVTNAGGYWIDQNSGNPNNGATASGTSGLCELCHGGGDGAWTAAELGAIDQFSGENLWISGYNGHANVVMGGPGPGANGSAESYARNIYTRAKRGTASVVIGSSTKVNVDMGLATDASGNRGYSYRANQTGYLYYPRIGTTSTTASGTSQPYSHRYFVWGGAAYQAATPGSAIATGTVALQVADTTGKLSTSATEAATYDAQANYHTFNCAKCHNPHASRLPKLMITNCLDTNHNSWDDGYNNDTSGLASPWTSTLASQWASAQNCHRLDSRASLSTGQSTGRGAGWNKVTPWLEDTTPDTYSVTNPNP